MPVVVHPDDPRPEIAIRYLGDWTRVLDTLDGTDPKVEDAINRGQERDSGTVMADAHDDPIGISEDQAAGKQV